MLAGLVPGIERAAAQESPRDERGVEREARKALDLVGLVFDCDGNPAEGVVVVSSAGGQAITNLAGTYRLAAQVPLAAERVIVSALGGEGGNLVASASVSMVGAHGTTNVAPLHLASGGACTPGWLPTFGPRPGAQTDVRAAVMLDDGSGPALYIGAGSRVSKWDGAAWSALGTFDGSTRALAVYDDGNGPALYVGGFFSSVDGVVASNVARWDGAGWQALGSGTSGTGVFALCVFDAGSGPELYVGGSFSFAGGLTTPCLGRWDGSSWSTVGGGLSFASVDALVVHDDGSGPALFAGGTFSSAGGIPANRIAKWDGATWSALGSGLGGFGSRVNALASFDDGAGPVLHVGGSFTSAGGAPASSIAKWDGANWATLGSGIGGGVVRAFGAYDDGGGPALYVGGSFSSAGGLPVQDLARWDGLSWAPLAEEVYDTVNCLTLYDDGGGPVLVAGGRFRRAGDVGVNYVARLEGTTWSAFGTGLNDGVYDLVVHDDGSGAALFVAGLFRTATSPAVRVCGKWDGTSWSALGTGLNHNTVAVSVFDDGSGPALYAGGIFTDAGGVPVSRVAKWDGTGWSALGAGLGSIGEIVWDLCPFDDGSGPALYAGGTFTTAGGLPAARIARWDGTSWSAMGDMNDDVLVLAVYDDGSGPALYAGGTFTTAGGLPAARIARWDGTSWSALGSGTSGTLDGAAHEGEVRALTVFDDGSGPALYVGGYFTSAGGVPASGLAKWDGATWSAVGGGVSGPVFALAVHDDGTGPALMVGGGFLTADSVAASGVAKWDGTSWLPLGSGLSGTPLAMASFDHGAGPALFVGGLFTAPSSDRNLAQWTCVEDTTPPVLECPISVVAVDRGFDQQEVVTFTVPATDDLDPAPDVVCVPPSGTVFPLGTTLVQCTATDIAGNQSTCSFPVTVRRKAAQR